MIPTIALIIAAIDAFWGAYLLVESIHTHNLNDQFPPHLDALIHAVNIAACILLLAVPLSFTAMRRRYLKTTPFLQYTAGWLLFAKGATYVAISCVIVNESMRGSLLFLAGMFYVFISALSYWAYRILTRSLKD